MKKEINYNLLTIDKSMGESRWAQILGVVVLVGVFVFAYLYKTGFF